MEKWVEQQPLEIQQKLQQQVEQQLPQRVRQQRLEAEEDAEQRGEQKGWQQGEAARLLRLLERRFGGVPDRARDRVLTADTDMIEERGLRLLDAATLEQALA